MPPAKPSRMLPDDERAVTMRGLARLEDSGIAPAEAARIVAGDGSPGMQVACQKMKALLDTGLDVGTAGFRAGLFSEVETQMLRAATTSGSPASTLNALAQRHERRASDRRRMRNRMLLPLAIFVVAVLAAPLPSLVAGTLGLASYLGAVLLTLAIPVAAWRLAIAVARQSEGAPSSLLRQLPVVGRLAHDRARADMLGFLAMGLRAGLDAQTALSVASQTVRERTLQRQLHATKRDVATGARVADALKRRDILDDAGYALASTGEGAGKLDESVQLAAQRIAEDVASLEDTLTIWLPRVVYFLVVAWVAGSLVG